MIKSPSLVELIEAICRVPWRALSLRLSILYLRTSVGLKYGIIVTNLFKDNFLNKQLFVGLCLIEFNVYLCLG